MSLRGVTAGIVIKSYKCLFALSSWLDIYRCRLLS